MMMGINEILIKPFDNKQLCIAIAAALSKVNPVVPEAVEESDASGQILL